MAIDPLPASGLTEELGAVIGGTIYLPRLFSTSGGQTVTTLTSGMTSQTSGPVSQTREDDGPESESETEESEGRETETESEPGDDFDDGG